MQNGTENKLGLPLPKWAMVIMALLTFYMPLAYLIMSVWVIGSMFLGYSLDTPDWMQFSLGISLYVTFVMWPVYLLWVILCKRLKSNEKALWILIVIFLNMLGMPMFYIFITRRYQGKEGQTNIKDENVAQALLTKCNLSRTELSPDQWQIWVHYCRKVRLCRLGIIPMVIVATLLLYTAIWHVNDYKAIFHNFYSAEAVNIYLSDVQAEKLNAKASMMAGVMAGAIGAYAIFIVTQVIGLAYMDWHRKTFIDFLKAKNKST